MMTITRVSAHEHDIFIPQVYGNGSFSSYSWHAFHDLRDDPTKMKQSFGSHLGEFNTFNGDLVIMACVDDFDIYSRLRGDVVTFDAENYEYALEYARRLRDYGRWAHAWSNPHNWPKYDRRGERLQVRLVRERMASITEEYPL